MKSVFPISINLNRNIRSPVNSHPAENLPVREHAPDEDVRLPPVFRQREFAVIVVPLPRHRERTVIAEHLRDHPRFLAEQLPVGFKQDAVFG